jgi:hypothetical protein
MFVAARRREACGGCQGDAYLQLRWAELMDLFGMAGAARSVADALLAVAGGEGPRPTRQEFDVLRQGRLPPPPPPPPPTLFLWC